MHSHDLEDLVQAGNVGLMTAARRFDPSRGFKFSTFANRRIIGAAIDHLRDIYGRRQQRVRPLLATDLPHDEDEQPMGQIAGDASPEIDRLVARVRRAVRDRLRALFPIRTAAMALMRVFDRQPFQSVADAFGLTEARVHQIVAPIREQVVAVIESEVAREASSA